MESSCSSYEQNRLKAIEVKNVIENTLKSKELEKGRKEVKEECWCFENESAGKTVDYIIEKSKELKV